MSDIDWDSDRLDLLHRVTTFFRTAGSLAARYTPEELKDLLWKFAGETGFLNVVFEERLPLEGRLECITSIKCMYLDLFQKHCTRGLSHGLREYPPDFSPLNGICYMWWDIFPSWGAPDNPQQRDVDQRILALLSELLEIEHEACRESALHGLGHWHLHYPGDSEKIVDRFLSSNHALPEKLKNYALAARCGCVN